MTIEDTTSTTVPRGRALRRRPPTRYVIVGIVAVLALLGALVGPTVLGYFSNPSAKDKIAADPPPTLFPATSISRIDALTAPQPAKASTLLEGWWKQHGTQADDAGFQAWLEATFPAPPSQTERTQEMAELTKLDNARTPAGITSATWLEAHGKKDVWKLAAHDQKEYLSEKKGKDLKKAEKDMLKMAKKAADDISAKDELSAPYVVRPSLRSDKTIAPGTVCPCSYPSRHASVAAASRTLLGQLMPQRDSEYRWWQDQIDYSRLYMAGHFASDISGGTLLGDMIGDYFLVTREGVSPAQLPTR
ncbi:hypothetical protein ABTZ46_10230 [Nocardioides sp. NPDC126508]